MDFDMMQADALRDFATTDDLIELVLSMREQQERSAAALENMRQVAHESQDWDWLAARNESEEKGVDYYCIDSMEALHQAADRDAGSKAILARRDVALLESITRDMEGCSNHGCVIREPAGASTNRRCRCISDHRKGMWIMQRLVQLRQRAESDAGRD